MRCVVQRVKEASVTVAGEIVGKIGRGYMVLVGVGTEDTDKDVRYMADKVPNLRLFEDDEEKMNLSLTDVGGEILAVSQFTLYGPQYVQHAQLIAKCPNCGNQIGITLSDSNCEIYMV